MKKPQDLITKLIESLHAVSQSTLEWIAIVMIHCAFIPSTLAYMRGITDLMPSMEVVLFAWGGLGVYFFKSLVENNRMMVVTNATGFFIQAMLLAMVVYK